MILVNASLIPFLFSSLLVIFLLMNSMSVQSHERSMYLRSLMFGDSVPNPAFLVKNFNVADFVGKWFVTSSLFTRSTVHRFVQDPVYPAMLYNHDNEFLHY